MFSYFTGAAKKAVSRRGKEPHKFRIDVAIVAVSGLPVKVKAACVTLERGGKRHVSGITRSVDHPPGVARWPEGSTPLNFVATLYRDPDGKFERKAFTVKARAEELDPDATGYGKLKTFAQGAVDLSAFASGLENLTSGDGEGGSGELVEIGLNDASSKTKGVTATVRVSVVWVKNYAALDADQASYTSSAGVTVAPGEEGGESGASDVMSVSAAAREQDLTGFAIDSDSDSNAESNDSDSGDARRLKAILGDFKGSLRSQLLSPVKEASPSKELGTPLGTPAKPSLTHSGRIQVKKFEIKDEDGGSEDDESKSVASSPASSAASTPGKRKMLNRTPVKTKSQAMWGNIRGRMNVAKAASALSGKSAKDSIASAFTKMDEELSLNKSASGSEGSGTPLETVEWATVGTALGVASPNPSPAKEGDISNMTIENVEASSSFRTSSSEVGERVMHLGARRVSESTAQGGDASRELELTKVRLAAAETRARDAEREANELRLRMESRGETSSSTSSGIIRGLSEVATRAKEGPLANDAAGGDVDTPGTRGSDHHGAFFTPAASADPTPTTTPKGRAGQMDTQNPKSKSDPPASPQRNQSETKPVPDTPPASPSTFASFFGFGESPSKPPNEESNKPPATEILAAASSSDDHSESGRDETETMRPLTDPAPVAFTNVEDAGGTGRRLYDADEADGAMATLRTELDHRSTQIGQLQDGVRRLMEQMSRVQSEKESVESVATDLTEKNASLQSKVIARVVHLMRNASTAKSFRTWRDVTQSEKISRAGAEKTAALMRASTDEFKVAKLTDEVEELRTRLEEATERAESAETKAATAEKWAAEAEAKAFDAVAKAEESAKEKTTDSLNAHTAIKAAEIRASEAESRALEALSKATDATEKSTKLQARIDSVREEANAVEVAAAKVVAESKQDAEDARALLDSARATADAAEASAAAIVRELKAQVADMSAQSKASETELANQSALIERLGDEVRRWRDEKTAADERAAESSLREETLRERLATASDETETLRQRLFGVTGEGNEGLSGRVLEEFQKPAESVAGSKQIPESELKSDPPASPVRNQSEEKPVPDTPPASPSTFASFFGFGESPSKPPNEESNKPPATEIPTAAESPAKPKPKPESVSGGQLDSPERRIAELSESMEDLRERHAEEADSLRERLVAAERSLEKTMVKAEERVVENRALNEEIEKVRAECTRLAAETTRARGEADAAEAEVEVMLAKLSTAADSDQLERQKQLQLEEHKQLVEEQKQIVEEHKQIADEKTEALAKAEREVASLEGKLADVTRELGAAKAAAEARAEAGKNVAAVEEKFERHKKLLDEKVRTLAKAESDVRALEGKLEDAARELAAAKAETAETAAAKAADKARTTDAGQELESMREKFEKHKKFADEKVRALAKAESDVRALEGKLERSMEESNARLAEATERASSLEREHKIAVESAAADASRAKDLAEELDSARKETAETAAKLATLERTHATHATRTATLEKSLDESRLEVKAKAEAAREFAGKLGELSDAKEKLEKELETARAYANKARGESEKAAEARAETDAKARAFAEEKRAERIASMDKEHKEALSKLEAKIQADTKHIAELKETAETAAKQSEERRSALAMAQREMKRVLSDKTDADAQIAELKDKFAKHKKFTEEKVRTLAKAESDVRALEGKLEDANREIRDAKAGGDAEKAEVTELRTKTAAQAKDLWAKAKELVKAREETRRMERYKTECEDLRSRLATLQTSNETMEKELIRARVASPASSPARSGNRSGNTSGVTSAASTPHRTPRSSQSASAGASLSATPERRKETAKETAGTASGPTHARIAEISTALDAARTDASDKERRLGELSEKLRALEVSSASALAAADSSKKTIEDLTAALNEANARVNAEKQRAARLGTELATKEAERAALTAEPVSKPSNSAPKKVETERVETESVEIDELRARLRATETTLARARDDASRADVAFERYKSETHASAASAASTHAEEAESLRRKLATFAAADSGAKKKVTILEEKVRISDAKLVQQTAESDARLKELTAQLDRSRADTKRLKTSLAESRDAETKASAGEQKASNKKEMLRVKCEDLASRAKLAETRASTARAECTAARRAKIDAQAGEAAAAASLKSAEAKLKAANSALESHRTRELSPLVSPTKPKRSPARRFSGSGTGTTDEELLSARNDAAEARSELDKERALRVKADESAALARSDADELRRALDSAEKGDWSAVEMALKPSPAPPPAVRTRVGVAEGVPGRRSLSKDFEGANTEPIYDETSDFEDARSELSVHSVVPSRETTPRDTRGGSVSPAAASPGLAEPRSMTQFYARENESLRARVAALETQLSDSAPKDTIPGSISASDETLVKRLQDAERRANDAEAQMTGMERAHLNALTALETSGRAAADAAADEQTELAAALVKIRAELVAAVAAREKAEKDAVDARKDAAASVAAARSALASTDATSPPNSPGGDSLLSPELSQRSPVSRSSRTHANSSRKLLQSVHQSLPSAESLAASKLASERVRKRREAEARRLVQEAAAKAAEDIDKKEHELAELRATVAKLRADADQAVRDRSKAEAKAWEWRRALRASEKAAKDAAGLLERRDKELQERRTAEKDRRAGVESRAHEGQGRTPLRGHRTVSSPTSATATPRHSTSTSHLSPGGGDILSPKPHPSTVESARLEAEELAMRRRLREEEFGVASPSGRQYQTGEFNPQTTPRRSDRVVRKAATPSRRSLDLRTPPRGGATPQSPVTHHDSSLVGSRQSPNNVAEAEAARLRAECAGLKSENERLAMDSSRWKDELALVADAARVEATNASAREVRRLENALAAADERARLSAAETKVLRETNQLNVHDARVQAAETEAKILRDELESLSVDLENARGDASAARAREETLAIQLVRSREISAKFQNAEVEKERLARANAKIADMTTQLGHMEDERFELRRALEAHVGALVEAKVDSAEHAGTVSELRKELARVNVKYQRAAARCAKMEAMVPARGDPTSAEYVSANVPA